MRQRRGGPSGTCIPDSDSGDYPAIMGQNFILSCAIFKICTTVDFCQSSAIMAMFPYTTKLLDNNPLFRECECV